MDLDFLLRANRKSGLPTVFAEGSVREDYRPGG